MKFLVVTTLFLASVAAAAQTPTPKAATKPAAAAAPAARMQAVGSVKDIMIALTIPLSNDVFNAASEAPKDAAGWTHTRNQALALAESANLLLMSERAGGRADWNAFAVAQRNAAVVAMKAAEKKDADTLSNASDALYETCDNCHKKYLPKN